MQTQITVLPEQGGQRLDRVLAAHDAVGSRARAAKLFSEGAVTIDGAQPKKSDLAIAGQTITLELLEPEVGRPERPAVPFEVIFEDDALLIVDKPAGLVVHPAPGHRSGTLSQALAGRASGGDPARPGIVHRLDRDTSGLLVVAKSDQVLRALQAALQAREITRSYTALVRGVPESAAGTIDAPLGRDRRDPASIAVRQDSTRNAVTHFETIEQLGPRTLLAVKLETGRTHQIRVHLAAVGLRVCGDPQYGVEGDLALLRQFLHASALGFAHPISGEQLNFESPLPRDLADALELARAER